MSFGLIPSFIWRRVTPTPHWYCWTKLLFSLQELSLILKSEAGDTNTDASPQAYYLVMPSSNSTLLVKSVVMEELMLPSNFPSLSDKTSQQSTEIIEDCLDIVGRLDPLQLYHTISHRTVPLPYQIIHASQPLFHASSGNVFFLLELSQCFGSILVACPRCLQPIFYEVQSLQVFHIKNSQKQPRIAGQ